MLQPGSDLALLAKAAFGLLLPMLIAGCVALIAYLQWRTAKNKLALDLFDRRLSVFTMINSAVEEFLSNGRALHPNDASERWKSSPMARFWTHYDSARFLFGPEVCDSLDELVERMSNFKSIASSLDAEEPGANETLLDHAESEVLDSLTRFRDAVSDYVSFGHIEVRRARPGDRRPRP